MAIGIADNFLYQGRKPLDSRIVKDTIADMTSMAESIIYDGIMVYNKETSKFYVFNSNNSVDAILKKWRELETGVATTPDTVIEEYKQGIDLKKNTLIIYNNEAYLVTKDFTSNNTESTVDDSFKYDLDNGNLVPINKNDYIDTNCLEYKQGEEYTTDKLVKHNNKLYTVTIDFTADTIEANEDLSFEKDLKAGNLVAVVTERKVSKVLPYTQATQYDKDTLVYVGSEIARVDIDYTSDATQATVEESFDFDVANSKLIPINSEGFVAVLPYAQDTDYLENSLVFLDEKIARVEANYHSDNTAGNTLEQSFEADIKNNKISLINTDHVQIMNQYAQSNMYFKDTLVYNGNLITRVMKDFIADSTESNVDDSFDKDVTAGNLLILNKEAELRNTSIQTRNFIL